MHGADETIRTGTIGRASSVSAVRRVQQESSSRLEGEVSELRLMAMHAHPDDESSKGAATMARLRRRRPPGAGCHADGWRARAASSTRRWTCPRCTGASPRSAATRWPRPPRSSASNTAGWASSTPGCPRATRRRRCPTAASRWCRSRSRSPRLVRVIREFRPHVMTTYDENGGYPHPDHIRCHQVSVAAFEAAADHRLHPDAGDPWDVQQAVLQPRLPAPAHAAAAGRVRQERPGGPVREVAEELGPRRSTSSPGG